MYKKMSDIEFDDICKKYIKDYALDFEKNPETGIREPIPSIVISVDYEYDAVDLDVIRRIEMSLIDILGFPFYIIDPAHEGYIISDLANFDMGDLPLSIIPDGDYVIFSDKSLQNGSFSHYANRTICFYGKKVVDSLKSVIEKGCVVYRNSM